MQSHLFIVISDTTDKKNIKGDNFAEDVAASGGYFIACAGDEIMQIQVLSLVLLESFLLHLVLKI